MTAPNIPYTIAEFAVLLRAVETVNAAMRRRAKLLGQPTLTDDDRSEVDKIDEILGDKDHGRSGADVEAWSLVRRFAATLDRQQPEPAPASIDTVVTQAPGPTPEQEREAIEAMREAEAAAEITGLRALVWGADGHGFNPSTGRWQPTIEPAVLWSSDALSRAVNGDDVGELLVYSDQAPPGPGMWVWEGVGRYGAGADPETNDPGELMLRGKYRPLRGPEILAALHGQPLPEIEPATHDEQAELEDSYGYSEGSL